MILLKIQKISEVQDMHQFVCVYGNSGVGKTRFVSTFPKPLLLIDCGDRKYQHISDVAGVYVVNVDTYSDVIKILNDKSIPKFKTVALDNLSGLLLLAREHQAKNKKLLTQQDWQNINYLAQEVVIKMKALSKNRYSVLVAHQKVYDTRNGDDNVIDTITFRSNPALRDWVEPNVNVAIHLSKMTKEVDDVDDLEDTTDLEVSFAAQVGPHPYYWTNAQGIKNAPQGVVLDPDFDKIFNIKGDK